MSERVSRARASDEALCGQVQAFGRCAAPPLRPHDSFLPGRSDYQVVRSPRSSAAAPPRWATCRAIRHRPACRPTAVPPQAPQDHGVACPRDRLAGGLSQDLEAPGL